MYSFSRFSTRSPLSWAYQCRQLSMMRRTWASIGDGYYIPLPFSLVLSLPLLFPMVLSAVAAPSAIVPELTNQKPGQSAPIGPIGSSQLPIQSALINQPMAAAAQPQNPPSKPQQQAMPSAPSSSSSSSVSSPSSYFPSSSSSSTLTPSSTQQHISVAANTRPQRGLSQTKWALGDEEEERKQRKGGGVKEGGRADTRGDRELKAEIKGYVSQAKDLMNDILFEASKLMPAAEKAAALDKQS